MQSHTGGYYKPISINLKKNWFLSHQNICSLFSTKENISEYLFSVVLNTKLKILRIKQWSLHVARTGQLRNANKIMFGKSAGRARQYGVPRHV